MVVLHLRYRRAKVALMNLVNAVCISLQKSITATDLDDMNRHTITKAYILEFERLTKQNRQQVESMPEKETGNILRRLNYFKELHSQQLHNTMLPSSLGAHDDFLDYLGDCIGDMPQLWSKFKV
ncbi:hypothetical protein A0J61_10998 [Choanephora cucurbitarum]|uniref:Uncharacterized protein n=1 Tax=Choanephora cucurbitarum TaxID=101091 RepID=A0A1C7N0S5_9FUNG|nr:hypothetical protein A0J61_10998 [Choanephora cucurbitarum]